MEDWIKRFQITRRLLTVLVCLAIFGMTRGGLWADPKQLSEYRLKALYLINFAKFIQWPAETFESPSAPVVIGILGKDPFNGRLAALTQGKLVHGRGLSVVKFPSVASLGTCHILFISRSERRNLTTILKNVKGSPVLTVSDLDRFARLWGIIQLVKREGKIRFEINVERARKVGVKLSSSLLELATIVGEATQEGED